ncbi:HAD family hydrolase [Anthocerotibacter panamensis]|uniref:HAD family hydrolase n=1 Tax=Anthocerotibacter panamensis TaxID=2857077 RepID=UPI001C406F41|nr:HAD family phosphatase [Anthocerotibacter panamensis]
MAVLVFDLMDTVVTDPFYEALPRYLGTTMEELLREKHPTSWLDFERGWIAEEAFLSQFYLPESGRTLADPLGLREIFYQYYAFVPGMEALLGELKHAGYPLWVLSNYPVWFEHIRTKLDLDRFFSGYVVSYTCGVRKPDQRCFQAFAERCRDADRKFILIDDREPNVLAAQKTGWEGILFTSAEGLRQELSQLKLYNWP